MSLLDSLFSGAKAFIREVVGAAAEVVRAVLVEVDKSSVGQAATGLIKGVTQRYFSQAADLAGEERQLAEKRQRDGRSTESDLERLREIEAERDHLRKTFDDARARNSAEELREAQAEVVTAPVTDDEASASVGILASKVCPECDGTMRVRQGDWNKTRERRSFYWQCTAPNLPPCRTIKLDPEAERASVIRRPDADLDGSHSKRDELWRDPSLVAKTHGRLRSGLGDDDEQVVCPQHLLPMKLMPKHMGGGLMLDSYEYVCLGVNLDGRACAHKVPVTTFPQVAATLRRREGRGILDS